MMSNMYYLIHPEDTIADLTYLCLDMSILISSEGFLTGDYLCYDTHDETISLPSSLVNLMVMTRTRLSI